MERNLVAGDRVEYIGGSWSSMRPGMVGQIVDVGPDELVVVWGHLTSSHRPEDLRIAPWENETPPGPVQGTVKWWKREKGYGVVLTPETAPKGIWVSFIHIEGEGFRELVQGEAVDIEYEPAMQDSFRFRATRVRRRP